MKRLSRLAMLVTLLFTVALVADAEARPDDKVTICHATSSTTNPFVTITISRSGWDGEGRNDHTLHAGDYEGECVSVPTPTPVPPVPTPVPPVPPTPTPVPPVSTPVPPVPDYPGPFVTPTPEPVFWLAGWSASRPTINFTG